MLPYRFTKEPSAEEKEELLMRTFEESEKFKFMSLEKVFPIEKEMI